MRISLQEAGLDKISSFCNHRNERMIKSDNIFQILYYSELLVKIKFTSRYLRMPEALGINERIINQWIRDRFFTKKVLHSLYSGD